MIKALMAFLLGFFVLVIENSPIYAIPIYMTGEELTKECRAFLHARRTGRWTAQQGFDVARCYGFVVGVLDALREEQIFELWNVCLPTNANANDLAETVALFLDQNPGTRNEAGYALVMRALAHSFPCPK